MMESLNSIQGSVNCSERCCTVRPELAEGVQAAASCSWHVLEGRTLYSRLTNQPHSALARAQPFRATRVSLSPSVDGFPHLAGARSLLKTNGGGCGWGGEQCKSEMPGINNRGRQSLETLERCILNL